MTIKAFWTVRANSNGGPAFPAVFTPLAVRTVGDIFLVDDGGHKHAVIGSIALGTNHAHWVFFTHGGSGVYQEMAVGAEHTHAFPDEPTHFLSFVICTEVEYDEFIAAAPNAIIVGHASVVENPDPTLPGDFLLEGLSSAAWDAPTRTAWENRFGNFGIALPVAVTNDRRLARFMIRSFHAHNSRVVNERHYRETSHQIG